MAPRNKPSLILNRDSAFTEAIGKAAPGKPNPFAKVGEHLAEKLDAARAAGNPNTVSTETDSVQPAQTEEAGEPLDRTDAAPDAPPPADLSSEKPAGASRAAPERTSRRRKEPDASGAAEDRPETGRAGDATASVELTITMRLHTDLTERAEKWAMSVGLPMGAVVRKTLNRMKPELMRELAAIKAGDVQVDRADSVGYRLQTQLRFKPDELAALEARLDPAGFGVLNSMLNYYTRSRFTAFLDRLMADAGY